MLVASNVMMGYVVVGERESVYISFSVALANVAVNRRWWFVGLDLIKTSSYEIV